MILYTVTRKSKEAGIKDYLLHQKDFSLIFAFKFWYQRSAQFVAHAILHVITPANFANKQEIFEITLKTPQMFSVHWHYASEIWKRSNRRSLLICVWVKPRQGN